MSRVDRRSDDLALRPHMWRAADDIPPKIILRRPRNLRGVTFYSFWKGFPMTTGTVKWFNPRRASASSLPMTARGMPLFHISAVERAGLPPLREGQKVIYDLVADKRSGKSSARTSRSFPDERFGSHQAPADRGCADGRSAVKRTQEPRPAVEAGLFFDERPRPLCGPLLLRGQVPETRVILHASSGARQQYRPSPAGAEEEDAARRHLPRDDAAQGL